MLRVAAVIPVFQEQAQAVERTVDSLLRQRQTPDEIVVVDDGSSPPLQLPEGLPVRLLHLPQNGGISAARNNAAALTTGDAICFVNSHVLLDDGWIERGVGVLEADRRIGVVGGAVEVISRGRLRAEWRRRFLEFQADGGAQDVAWLHGHALLVRRTALAEVGGFDESLRVAHEDVDLGTRVRDAGWRVRFDPSLTARSTDPTNVRALARKCLRHQGWWLDDRRMPQRGYRLVEPVGTVLSCLRDSKWHMARNLSDRRAALLPLDAAVGAAELLEVALVLGRRAARAGRA